MLWLVDGTAVSAYNSEFYRYCEHTVRMPDWQNGRAFLLKVWSEERGSTQPFHLKNGCT